MTKHFKRNKGFSLIELIIVVAIMAVLIGVLAPQYIQYVEKSKVSKDQDIADAIKTACYMAIGDEELVQNLDDGDWITFDKVDGIKASDPGVQSCLEEYFNEDLSKMKPRSKQYGAKQYKVEFVERTGTDTIFAIAGGWN